MLAKKFSKVILWGLTHKRDSFRFIYTGFEHALKDLGFEVYWVADLPTSNNFLGDKTLVFAVDISSQHLRFVKGTTYLTLNISEYSRVGKELAESDNWFKIQEHTKSSHGIPDSEGSIALFRPERRLMYIPWGTPLLEHQFFSTRVSSFNSTKEYWVGAVWNDKLNQGNLDAIADYKRALAGKGVTFKRVGGSRIRKNGLSEMENANKVRSSRLGAAIVGNWQRENIYYPCRLFKAVSAGIPPTSNLDASPIFGDTLLHSENIEELVDLSYAESMDIRQDRASAAQILLKNYTYKANLIRIFRMLDHEW